MCACATCKKSCLYNALTHRWCFSTPYFHYLFELHVEACKTSCCLFLLRFASRWFLDWWLLDAASTGRRKFLTSPMNAFFSALLTWSRGLLHISSTFSCPSHTLHYQDKRRICNANPYGRHHIHPWLRHYQWRRRRLNAIGGCNRCWWRSCWCHGQLKYLKYQN